MSGRIFSFLALVQSVILGVFLICAPAGAAQREGILLVAFGTSVPEARSAFAAIAQSYRKKFPNTPLEWAFTSQKIRKKLQQSGIDAPSIEDGLARLAMEGARIVRVQSLHVLPGEEFAGLARSVLLNVKQHPARFEAVYLARPLLESAADARDVAEEVLKNLAPQRQPGEALVLMGHGNESGRGDLVFEGVRQAFSAQDPLVFMATVEGARSFDDLLQELQDKKVTTVWLAPFMVVAGDHARNDLGGNDEDSWASLLRKHGFRVRTVLTGLGELPGVAGIFARHTSETEDDLTREPKKP